MLPSIAGSENIDARGGVESGQIQWLRPVSDVDIEPHKLGVGVAGGLDTPTRFNSVHAAA